MSEKAFHVIITGDTGVDIYTQYVTGYVAPDERIKQKAAYDVSVPAGASFTTLAFKAAFDPVKPKDGETVQVGSTTEIRGQNDADNGHIPITLTHLIPQDLFDAQSHTVKANHITMHKFLVEMAHFPVSRHDEERTAVRVKETWPICDNAKQLNPDAFEKLIKADGQQSIDDDADLLLIHDGDGSWRHYPSPTTPATAQIGVNNTVASAMGVVKAMLTKTRDDSGKPRIIVNLRHLPEVAPDEHGRLRFRGDMTFWKELAEKPEHVCIVCSANVLRREGAAISRRLSWEQTIEDLARDLVQFDKLSVLADFEHLIIRFGIVGAIHLGWQYQNGVRKSRIADLIFAPTARAGYYRDPLEDGNMVGENVMLAAAITHKMASSKSAVFDREHFRHALRCGLTACMKSYDKGYKIEWHGRFDRGQLEPVNANNGEDVVTELFKQIRLELTAPIEVSSKLPQEKKLQEGRRLGHVTIPESLFDPTKAGSAHVDFPTWEMLKLALDGDPSQPLSMSNRINVGSAIALFGHKSVLNREWTATQMSESDKNVWLTLSRPPCTGLGENPDYRVIHAASGLSNSPNARPRPIIPFTPTSIYVPVATFEKLVVVEREEIESLRSIRNLIKAYHDQSPQNSGANTPISIAVFGPPGSGKSFAVKQIAKEINSGLHHSRKGLETVEYNVAQFRSINDLESAITRASMIASEGKLPLVFFDEFDCHYHNELGWLKYFLAPMQDGMFYGPNQTIRITRAVFVFAGGMSQTFEQFDPSSAEPVTQHADADWASRRQAFRNQKGPDFISRLRGHINILPINPSSIRDKDLKPVIRRAIILRGIMESKGLIVRVGSQKIAQIDEDVLYALLTIGHYRHGTRSMEAILQMCTKMDGRIEKASLPSRAQINMHVDADEFFTQIFRGRARPAVPKPYPNSFAPSPPTGGRPQAVVKQADGLGGTGQNDQFEVAPSSPTKGSEIAGNSENPKK